jgi:hypothetical protein
MSVDIWPPVPGLYAMPLVRCGIKVAVRIWFGAAIIDGEEQDRRHDWRVEIDGATDRVESDEATGYRCRVALDIHQAWPFCARTPIDAKEYKFLLRRKEWAREHAPEHPAARPRESVDVRTLKPAF